MQDARTVREPCLDDLDDLLRYYATPAPPDFGAGASRESTVDYLLDERLKIKSAQPS